MNVQYAWLEPIKSWGLWGAPMAIALFLVVISQINFLALHTLAELFAIVISFIMFAFAWSTRKFSKNYFLITVFFIPCKVSEKIER